MLLVLSIIVFVTIVLAVFAFGSAAATPSSVLGARLKSLGTQRVQVSPQRQPIRERLEQALDPLSKALPVSPTDVSQTRAWLIQAGYRDPKHVTLFYAVRALFAFIGLAGVIVFGYAKSPMLLIGVPAFGFFLPRFFLKRKIRDRQTRIRVGLPDALDLTVICVEAGLALDQAMMRPCLSRFMR